MGPTIPKKLVANKPPENDKQDGLRHMQCSYVGAEVISIVFQYWSNFNASPRGGIGTDGTEHSSQSVSTQGEGSRPVPEEKNWGVLNLGGGGSRNLGHSLKSICFCMASL